MRTNNDNLTSSKFSPPITGENIHVVTDFFEPKELEAIDEGLKGCGFRSVFIEGAAEICRISPEESPGLLLIAATTGELPRFKAAIRKLKKRLEIPVLLYLKHHPSDIRKEPLGPEIDDILIAPFNIENMCLRVQRLLQLFARKNDEVSQSQQHLIAHFGMRQFVGVAPSFVTVIEKIPRVASCDVPVLLTGDTGTGKEMCARAIHYMSPRADKPFVPINCGSIPVELFENEMFGHESGAFTDARQKRAGLVAEAEGGTLFLDEVDSLPLSTQVKLLRFLQDKQYKPLGASNYRQADTRLIAASNQNLTNKVRDGVFRADLYYRLRVVSLHLPSLSDRKEDILPLALHFLKMAASEYKRHVTRFSQHAIQKLLFHSWPGNVRELENVVRHAVVLVEGSVIRTHDLQLMTESEAPSVPMPEKRESFKTAKARMIESFERNYLKDILINCGGNISKAAREAKKDRRAFFALLKKYDLTTSFNCVESQADEMTLMHD
jgi:DNA-binding NtrC family response regulator